MYVNVYQMVTDRIIKEMENGVIPWERSWTGVNTGAFNRITKKPYSLMNQLLLNKPGEWAILKQWNELGGRIKKGEKASIVTFWKIQPVEQIQEDGTTETVNIPLLRYYNVFHISQVTGVEPLEKQELEEIEPIERAEQIKEDYKQREQIEIKEIVSNKAYYAPTGDYIQVPCRGQYTSANQFYQVLYHEMVHSTGHKNRLGRFTDSTPVAAFGSADYSKEELVAEIGSAMLLNQIGIDTTKTFKNSVAYLQGWLKVLRDYNRFIISASSKAEKAVKYILNIQDEA